MDNDTDDTSETDAILGAPVGCDTCAIGVEIVDGRRIRACASCSHTRHGHRTDREAVRLVIETLAALADIRELLWPIGAPDAAWSPDTLDQIARRLECLRTEPNYPAADAVRYVRAAPVRTGSKASRIANPFASARLQPVRSE